MPSYDLHNDDVFGTLREHAKLSMPLLEDEGGGRKAVCAVDPQAAGRAGGSNQLPGAIVATKKAPINAREMDVKRIVFKSWLSLAAVVALAGCGTSQWGDPGGALCDSNMVQLGPDTYMATGKYGNGCGSSYKIRHAGQFCRQQGAEVIVQNIDNSPGGDVIFQCLRPGDQGLQRPSYQRAPDMIIEHR